MKTLDLNFGNPLFLSPYWHNINLTISSNIDMGYKLEGLLKLKEAIKKLHIQENNANVEDYCIVIGTGATQVLSAIINVLDKPVIAKAPYYLRFPSIAENAGVPWKMCPNGIEIITNPNNPDGQIRTTKSNLFPVYDLSYNWSQYTNPIKYNEDIMVFSLSKATGHASTRIGWALIKDKTLAMKIENKIDILTSGVSLESQYKALKIIKSQLKRKNTCFKYGRKILLERHNQLNQMKLPFKKLNHNGMFLWCEGENLYEFLTSKNIIWTEGKLLGPYYHHGRINIGCSDKDFKELIKRLS